MVDITTQARQYADTLRTDPAGWRLKVSEDSHGQHKWLYLPPEQRDAWPQTAVDKYSMGEPTGLPDQPKAKTPLEAARNGLRYYRELQSEDGHFATEYGGPLFLTPGLIIALQVCGVELPQPKKDELKRYLLNKLRPEGGWGLHTAAPPTVYGTVMNYVCLRMLGMGPDEGPMTAIRAKIHEFGGAVAIPTWGKVWLSILGAYDWEGVNPTPPELWYDDFSAALTTGACRTGCHSHRGGGGFTCDSSSPRWPGCGARALSPPRRSSCASSARRSTCSRTSRSTGRGSATTRTRSICTRRTTRSTTR